MTILACPACGRQSFTLEVTGYQEKAHFAQKPTGEPFLAEAGFVEVDEYDTERIRCGCGLILTIDELVEVER